MTRNKKILLCIAAIIIVAGIIVKAVAGLNIGTTYADSKQIKLYIATDVNTEQIKSITDTVFQGQPVEIQVVELFNDEVAITTNQITDEQLQEFVTITNQEFNLNNTVSNITVTEIPGIELNDIVIPYILPVCISLAIVLLYMGIKYKKEGIKNSVLIPLGIVVLIEILYYSLISIFRIPVNRYTMPIAIGILLITLTAIIFKKENEEKSVE